MLKQKRATRNLTENEFQLNVVYIQLSCVLGSGETVKRESREKNRQLNNKKQKTRDLTNEHFILWDYKLRSNKMLAIFTVSPLTFLLFFFFFFYICLFVSWCTFVRCASFVAYLTIRFKYGANIHVTFCSLHELSEPKSEYHTHMCKWEVIFFLFMQRKTHKICKIIGLSQFSYIHKRLHARHVS